MCEMNFESCIELNWIFFAMVRSAHGQEFIVLSISLNFLENS